MVSVGSPEEQNCLVDLKKILKAHTKEFEGFEWLLNDRFYLHFVRGKKYNAEKAASAFRIYFSIRRNKYKKLIQSIKPDSEPMLKQGIVRILKHQDTFGRFHVVIRFPLWTDTELTGDDLTRTLVLTAEEMWNFPDSEIHGMVIIVDLNGFGWTHFKIWNPIEVYRAINVVWNNMPLRYYKIHLLNTSHIFGMTFNAAKSFMPKKLRDRIIIYSEDWTEFHNEISPLHLPISLGGKLLENDAFDSEFENRISEKTSHYNRFAQSL